LVFGLTSLDIGCSNTQVECSSPDEINVYETQVWRLCGNNCRCIDASRCSCAVACEAARTPQKLEFENIDHARVIKIEAGNQGYIEGAITVGDYAVLTSVEQLSRLQSSANSVRMQPIRLLSTGQIVLSEGRLIVEVRDLDTSEAIAADYGLELVSNLSAISRIVL
jgi:hypothetical protein